MKPYIAILLLSTLAGNANAIQDVNKSIGRLGVQGNTAYFTLKEGFSTNCLYGVIYMNITTDFGKLAYANILSAKAAGTKLSWITYDQTAGGQCLLSTVEAAE
jgi:hypothetical protein